MDRRSVLKGALAVGALPLAGRLADPALAQSADLRLYWWGGPDRTRRTLAVADLFKAANPGMSASGEAVGADYWPKLSTMLVGRNLPDVIQFEPTTLPDYARRSAMLELDPFLKKTIRTDQFAKGVLDLGTVDGKVYGIALGLNAFSLFYDADLFAKAGIAPPKDGITWDEIARLAVEIGKAGGKEKFWGITNGARYNYVFDCWLHQRGKSLFTPEGNLGFTVDDAKEWYDYWEKVRLSGGAVAADIQSGDQHLIDSNPLTTGNAAMAFTFSNQLIGYQSVLKQKIGITTLPISKAGGPSGLYYRPALIWSVGRTSKQAEAAAKFIDFFVNNPDAGKILGVERGVPVNLAVRAQVAPTLNDLERQTVAYVDAIADKVVPYPPPVPLGATEFDQKVMRTLADQLGFGRITVAQAAEQLVSEGKRVIRPS